MPIYVVKKTLFCLVLAFALPPVAGCGRRTPWVDAPEASEPAQVLSVEIAGRIFELELALTPEARYRGLSDRPHIHENGGMLFVFPEPVPSAFVMRNCLVPIDILFLDRRGSVLNMHRMAVEPYGRPDAMLRSYPSRGPALMAIELAGGSLDRLAVREGDHIKLPIGTLRALAR